MAIPIIHFWERYFTEPHEGLGSTYERFIINELLFRVASEQKIETVLESPSFGFTGLSGINSLGLALQGIAVTVTDTDKHRLELISEVWRAYQTDATFNLINADGELPYNDGAFDMSWNFSALWFIADLARFCSELCRVTQKVIVIMVPNRSGFGYKMQRRSGKDDLKRLLKEENIKPEIFTQLIKEQGWALKENAYIDCPLWPDIGMSKESFLKKLKLGWLLPKKKKPTKPLSILNYYNHSEPDMKERMMRYNFFEKYLPVWLKRYWSHHRYYIFIKVNKTDDF